MQRAGSWELVTIGCAQAPCVHQRSSIYSPSRFVLENSSPPSHPTLLWTRVPRLPASDRRARVSSDAGGARAHWRPPARGVVAHPGRRPTAGPPRGRGGAAAPPPTARAPAAPTGDAQRAPARAPFAPPPPTGGPPSRRRGRRRRPRGAGAPLTHPPRHGGGVSAALCHAWRLGQGPVDGRAMRGRGWRRPFKRPNRGGRHVARARPLTGRGRPQRPQPAVGDPRQPPYVTGRRRQP